MGETSGMGAAFKLGIRQRLAHKKYKKSDAKVIARKIKKIQDKPDKVYTPYPPTLFVFPKRELVTVTMHVQNGDKTTCHKISVNDPFYKELCNLM